MFFPPSSAVCALSSFPSSYLHTHYFTMCVFSSSTHTPSLHTLSLHTLSSHSLLTLSQLTLHATHSTLTSHIPCAHLTLSPFSCENLLLILQKQVEKKRHCIIIDKSNSREQPHRTKNQELQLFPKVSSFPYSQACGQTIIITNLSLLILLTFYTSQLRAPRSATCILL